MSFSPGQQPGYRAMVEWAWQRHCTANAIPLGNRTTHRVWYEAQLFEATGKRSTVQCDVKRDYEDAMSHFEGLSGGGCDKRGPFYWTMRKFGADYRRMLHTVQSEYGEMFVEEQYVCATAKRALKLDYFPDLATLTYDDLLIVIRAIVRDARSAQRQGSPTVPVKRQYTLHRSTNRSTPARKAEQSNMPF